MKITSVSFQTCFSKLQAAAPKSDFWKSAAAGVLAAGSTMAALALYYASKAAPIIIKQAEVLCPTASPSMTALMPEVLCPTASPSMTALMPEVLAPTASPSMTALMSEVLPPTDFPSITVAALILGLLICICPPPSKKNKSEPVIPAWLQQTKSVPLKASSPVNFSVEPVLKSTQPLSPFTLGSRKLEEARDEFVVCQLKKIKKNWDEILDKKDQELKSTYLEEVSLMLRRLKEGNPRDYKEMSLQDLESYVKELRVKLKHLQEREGSRISEGT